MLLHINSEDRSSGSNEEFTIDFSNIAGYAAKGGGIVSVKTVEIPLTYYNFRNGINNTFRYIDSNSISHTIYIGSTGLLKEGSPTASQGIANIVAQLNVNAAGDVWTISLDPTRATLIITCNHSAQWVFDIDPEVPQALGFSPGTAGINFLAAVPYQTANSVNFSPILFLYLRSSIPTVHGKDFDSFSSSASDILCKIPTNFSQFSNTQYEPRVVSNKLIPVLNGNIAFKLTDSKNRVVNLTGHAWSFTMDFEKA